MSDTLAPVRGLYYLYNLPSRHGLSRPPPRRPATTSARPDNPPRALTRTYSREYAHPAPPFPPADSPSVPRSSLAVTPGLAGGGAALLRAEPGSEGQPGRGTLPARGRPVRVP